MKGDAFSSIDGGGVPFVWQLTLLVGNDKPWVIGWSIDPANSVRVISEDVVDAVIDYLVASLNVRTAVPFMHPLIKKVQILMIVRRNPVPAVDVSGTSGIYQNDVRVIRWLGTRIDPCIIQDNIISASVVYKG